MVVACFLFDLCSISPPLLKDLKQIQQKLLSLPLAPLIEHIPSMEVLAIVSCLLQLANLYAISSPSSSRHRSECLRDRIGLCYVFKNRISSSYEVIAFLYSSYYIHFLFLVRNGPQLTFLVDVKLPTVLSDVLYSWEDKDFMRKVIVLTSCLPEKIDTAMKNTLTDAADKCVSVEFVLFDQSASHLSNVQENINCFARSLADLDNCSFQTFLPDSRLFHSLVKQWLLDLRDDVEEPLQARFIFKSNLVGSLNQINCSLSISVGHKIDGFDACKTCRCHGIVLDNEAKNKVEGPSCPVTGRDLGRADVIENSVRVGDKTILFMPSFHSTIKLHRVSSPIEFRIIETTNLMSLSEGVIFGTSYFVAPSACNEIETSSEEMNQSELNNQLFQGVCGALHTMDRGLVCSSYYNVDTMRETAFHCYYILQPSDKGPMLLRRLAGLEEVMPIPDINQFVDSSVSKDT
uniref:Uncharacterized protein n=1 Tax=Manihot esculenta TaxID=3983 RepID=A0A251J9P7_MANES